MTEQVDELPSFLTPEEADALKQQYPNLVVSTKPQYAPMDPTKEGAWRVFSVGKTPVAVAWTDWEDGAGVIQIDSEASDSLYQHFLTGKRMNMQAGLTYSSSQYVKGYTFTDEMSGPLSAAMNSIPQPEEVDDEPNE